MKNDPKTPPPSAPAVDLQVRLKPLFGVKPGVYLLVLYSLIALWALWWLALEPGIQSPGTLYTFTSTPSEAAVFFNGKYYGSTPVKAYLPQGQGELEFRRTHFSSDKQVLTVENNLLFSRFFPATGAVHGTLKEGTPEKIILDFESELQNWSMTSPSQTEYAYPNVFAFLRNQEEYVGVSYPLPSLFTRVKDDLLAAGYPDEKVKAFLTAQKAWVQDPSLYQDLAKALGGDLTGLDFQAQLSWWSSLIPSPGLAPWVFVNQPYKSRTKITQDPTFQKALADWQSRVTGENSRAGAPAAPLTLSGVELRGVPGGRYVLGTLDLSLEPPFGGAQVVEIPPFYLGTTEVTNRQFAQFIAEQPQWSPGQKADLLSAGLVEDRYLKTWEGNRPAPGQEDFPVTFVSAPAAEAFAQWVQSKNPGWTVSLPTEHQWVWAAREASPKASPWEGENLRGDMLPVSRLGANALGLKGLSASVWEWTATPAALSSDFFPQDLPLASSLAPRIIKGGSYADKTITDWSVRGYHKASWTSPTVGFRLAAVRK